MRAVTTAKLASGRVIAGIIRNALHCPFCGHAQAGSAYAICPDCNRFNPEWQQSPIAQRLVRHASFDRFPHRAINLRDEWKRQRDRNRPDIALRIAEYALGRSEIVHAPLSTRERESAWAFTRRVNACFVYSTALEDAFARIFADRRSSGTCYGRAANGDSLTVSDYAGETLPERYGIDASEAERCATYGPAADGDDSVQLAAESLVLDAVSRVRPINKQQHAAQLERFLASRGLTLESLDSKPVRKHRVFIGVKHSSGTYSYGMQRREPTKGISSRRYARNATPGALARYAAA